jgi:hypothetical protein
MESFIRGENLTTVVKVPELGPPPRPANAACVSAARDVFVEEQALSVPALSRGSRLLQGKALQDFTNAVSSGLANAELAGRFGITPRQANSLRMGIEKRLPHLRMTKVANPEKRGIDRGTELRMQEEFLDRRPKPPTTFDDVVRFLRQRGDVVVRSGDVFVVNGHHTMTTTEIVDWANVKRRELGFPAFRVELAPTREEGVGATAAR